MPSACSRLVALVASLSFFTACPALVTSPGPDGGPPDAGSPDAAPDGGADAGALDAGALDAGTPPVARDGGVVFLDWLTVRGAPLTPVVEAELPGRPFALSDTTYALESECDAGACTYAWYADGGALLRRHVGLAPVATDSFSTDGTKFAALEVTERFVCSAMGASLPLVEGTWGLYDGLTGERLVAHGPMVADPGLIGSAFTTHGTIVRRERYDRSTCELTETTPLLTTPPYTTPTVLAAIPSDPAFPPYVEDDTADGRLIVSGRAGLDSPVGLARPLDVASYLQLDADHRLVQQSGGFVHVLGAFPFSRLASVQLAPQTRRDTPLPTSEAYFSAAVFSRQWVMACAQDRPGERRCDAVDGLGQRARRTTIVGPALPALAGALETAVYRTPDGGIEQLDLVTGDRTMIDVPATTVRSVGIGDAFLLNDVDRAWGLTRGVPFRLGERVRALYRGATQVEQPQSDVVLIVSSNETGSRTFLDLWNVKEGKVARVTDELFFNPPFNAPFTADTQCGAPGFLRSLGPPSASASQPGRVIHFTTFVAGVQPKVQVFVVPADLSSPPRRLAELEPDQCSPPLVSPSGRRVWLPVVMNGGVRVVLAPL
ncbi:MAG: hypothetical protein Q8S33_05075 [Myxococcales bacterium]|nr:hypothetical protein [Myxococcales bacterium]